MHKALQSIAYLAVTLGESLKHVLVLHLLGFTMGLHLYVHIDELTLGGTVVWVNLQELEKVSLGELKVFLPKVGLTTTKETFLILSVNLQCLVTVLLCLNVLFSFEVAHGQIEITSNQGLTSTIFQFALKLIQQTDVLNDALVLLNGQLEFRFLEKMGKYYFT